MAGNVRGWSASRLGEYLFQWTKATDLLMRRDVVISQNISSLYPQGEDSVEYFLGLTPSGIILLRNKTKVGNYYWPRINKIYYKVKKFISRFFIPNKYRIYLYVNISPNIFFKLSLNICMNVLIY